MLSPSKVCGNSTTQEFHIGKNGKKADLAQWSEGFKLQGPICQVTTCSVIFVIILERFPKSWRLWKNGPDCSLERASFGNEAQIIEHKQQTNERRIRTKGIIGNMEQPEPDRQRFVQSKKWHKIQ